MKKKIVPPTPSRPFPWLSVAMLSLVANVILLAWHFRTAAPRTETSVAPVTTRSSSATTWSRELKPYAALGSYMAENNRIPDLKWNDAQFTAFQEGFRSSYEGRGVPLDEAATMLRDAISERVQRMVEAEQPDPVRDYFRFLRDKEAVKEAPSGLHYRITEEGTGEPPKATDVVAMSYAAGLSDGTKLPVLSRARVTVPVRDLLPGLAEGVQLLRVGGKAMIYVPPALAFKETDWPPQVPRGLPLVFFVELHDITPAR